MGTQHLLKSVACQWRQLSYELKSTSVLRNEDPPPPSPPPPFAPRGRTTKIKVAKVGAPRARVTSAKVRPTPHA